MTSFLVNAQEIFNVASQSQEPEDLTIYLNNTTFRIKRSQGRVTVEGESGVERCRIESAKRNKKIPDQPRYLLM